MPTFELQGPDGGTYEVEAPDEGAAIAAFKKLPTAEAPAPAPAPGKDTSLLRKAADAYDSVRGSVPIDTAMNSAGGIVRGAAGIAGLPNAGIRLAEAGLGWAVNKGAHLAGLTTNSDRGLDTSSGIADGFVKPETIEHALDPVLPTPQTIPGKFAKTGGEFLGGMLAAPSTYGAKLASRLEMAGGETVAREALQSPTRDKLTRELLPVVGSAAVGSEGAGELTQGTAAEPWARAGGALLGGGAAALATGPSTFEKLSGAAARGRVSKEQFDAAHALKQEMPWLTTSEAVQWATNGGTGLGRMQRITESIPAGEDAMKGFFAARPAQMQAATEEALSGLGPRPDYLGQLGHEVQQAGRGAVNASPEGQRLARALQATGEDMSAGQAGAVIQPELAQTQAGHLAHRKAVADAEYDTARHSPDRIGIDRTVTVERPGEPVVTQPNYSRPQFHDDAPRPLDPFAAGAAEDALPVGESLARFVAKNGGIDLSGDARAADLHRFVIPGVGKVAREGGKSIDGYWRTALKEAGYLSRDADGYTTQDIENLLLRHLSNEQRDKALAHYPQGTQGRSADRAASGRARDDYENDLSTHRSRLHEDLSSAGLNPSAMHPDIESRTLGALMRGEHRDPLDAYEHVTSRLREPPAPVSTPTTVTEEISAPRFGQVDPRGAADRIDRQRVSAKGDVYRDLGRTERDLVEHRPDPVSGVREWDLSVAGNLQARERLDMLIRKATEDGDTTKVMHLQATRAELDKALKAVPEVATADANFAANSVPLEPFAATRPLGRAVQRDLDTRQLMMPREEVPPMLATAEGVRELRANAGPQSQAAMDDYLTTRGYYAGYKPGEYGGVSANKLAGHMRQNEDLLREAPTVQERLARVLSSREDLAPVEASAVGRIGATGKVGQQLEHLLGAETRPVETTQAVRDLGMQNPTATRGLVREGAGRLADRTVHKPDALGRPDQLGGAKFAREYLGPGEGEKLRAAIAEAGGRDTARHVGRVAEGLQATGWREGRGSLTAFNSEILNEGKSGGPLGELAKTAARPIHSVHDRITRALLARQGEKSAHLQMSPDGVRRLEDLANSPTRAALIALLAAQAAHRR